MSATESSAANPTIVLVDDDRFLLDLYAMKFMRRGYDVHAFLSANDALTALRSGLTPSVILTDLVMPSMDGYTLLSTMRDEHLSPDASRIVLTNEQVAGIQAKVEALGVSRVIVKATMLPDQVVSVVDEAISKPHPAHLA